MDKIIRIGVNPAFSNNTYEEIEFSFDKSIDNIEKELLGLIGSNCFKYKIVAPQIIQELLNVSSYPSEKSDVGIVMLCECDVNEDNVNALATVMYMSDGLKLLSGNCLILGTRLNSNNKIEFCPIPETKLERIRYFIDTMLGNNKDLSREQIIKGKQCVSCIKLNKENGGTLPFVCPELNSVCFCFNTYNEALKELDNRFRSYCIEKSFNECWDNNNMPNLLNVLKDMLSNDDEMRQVRANIDDDIVFNQDLITASLQAWDVLVKNGDKDIYIYDRK